MIKGWFHYYERYNQGGWLKILPLYYPDFENYGFDVRNQIMQQCNIWLWRLHPEVNQGEKETRGLIGVQGKYIFVPYLEDYLNDHSDTR